MSSDASRLDHACYLFPYLLVSPLQFCVVSVSVGSILGAAAATGAAFVVAFIGLLVKKDSTRYQFDENTILCKKDSHVPNKNFPLRTSAF